MPLTALQVEIARGLAANRTPDSYLAGGSALHIEPNSKRYKGGLDYFHDSEERVASAFRQDERTLIESGFDVEVLVTLPGFVRALVKRGNDATKIEWAHDSAFRFMPPIQTESAGFQLHPIDLATNKLLALVGRDEPRDYLDVHDIIERILPLGALCWAASGKDPGLTPHMILELLRRRGKYQPADFARLALTESVDLVLLKRQWLAALDDAETFVSSRDPDEVGCLYYSPERDAFVQPEPGERVAVHFGRPGGVLPQLQE